jgi:hypothetical protein
MAGTLAEILPSIAAEELKKLGLVEIQAKVLQLFERKICLAWSPRQLRILVALEKARSVFTDSFRIY